MISISLALLAPGKTPASTIDKLNRILNEALHAPEVLEQFATLGMTPEGGKPEDLDKLMHHEQRSETALIKELNITAE